MSDTTIKLAAIKEKDARRAPGRSPAVGGEIRQETPLHRLEALPRRRSLRPLFTVLVALGGSAILLQQMYAVWQVSTAVTPPSTTAISLPSVDEDELALIRSRESGQERVHFENVPVGGRTNPFTGATAAPPPIENEATALPANVTGGNVEYPSGDQAPTVNTNNL